MTRTPSVASATGNLFSAGRVWHPKPYVGEFFAYDGRSKISLYIATGYWLGWFDTLSSLVQIGVCASSEKMIGLANQ